eukprot:15457151-Alexandrium_andersonii.AAC.1
MPGTVLRPATSLFVAARSVHPCLTLRCHAKLVMPDTSECAHTARSRNAIPSLSPTVSSLLP